MLCGGISPEMASGVTAPHQYPKDVEEERMSDYYKCEHGSTLCGSCVRALKIDRNSIESKLAIAREGLKRIASGRTEKQPGMSVQSRPLSQYENMDIATSTLKEIGEE